MKIRNGFVSNSSSCSFMCIGYRIKRDDDEALMKLAKIINEKPLEKDDDIYDIIYDSDEVIVDEDYIYIGFTSEVHDYDYDVTEQEIEIDEIHKMANKELFNQNLVTTPT